LTSFWQTSLQRCDSAIREAQAEIGELSGLGLRVGDVQNGEVVLLLDAFEHGGGLTAHGFIEGGERFVEQEESRTGGKGTGDGDALFFAAGEGVGLAVKEVGDGEFFGELADAGVGGQATEIQSEGDLIEDL
jgi:hypothetical protein